MRRISLSALTLALAVGLTVGSSHLQSASAGRFYLYSAQGDYAHISGNTVSAHAWWKWETPGAPARTALVSIRMEKFVGGKWVPTGPIGQATLNPGTGGSGRRVTAKAPCQGTASTPWRSTVFASVNRLPGDTVNISATTTTLSRTLRCG